MIEVHQCLFSLSLSLSDIISPFQVPTFDHKTLVRLKLQVTTSLELVTLQSVVEGGAMEEIRVGTARLHSAAVYRDGHKIEVYHFITRIIISDMFDFMNTAIQLHYMGRTL